MSDLARQLQRRRNEVCVPPEFPGTPDDYRYVPERCVPRRPRPSGERRSRPGKLTRSGVRTELEVVRAVLRTTQQRSQVPEFTDMRNAREFVVEYRKLVIKASDLFRAMIQRSARAAHPDPVARFEALGADVDPVLMPAVRRQVFKLLEAHLDALLQ